jgi:pilus assembly protein Flp/PilA
VSAGALCPLKMLQGEAVRPAGGAKVSMCGQVPRTASAAEDGATAVEYGVLIALIAGVVIAVIATIGGTLLTQLTNFANSLP